MDEKFSDSMQHCVVNRITKFQSSSFLQAERRMSPISHSWVKNWNCMCDKAGKQNWMSNILSKVQMTWAMPLSRPIAWKLWGKKEQNLHTVVHFCARIQIKANNNKNSLVIFLSLNKTIAILAEYYHRVHLSRWPCTPTQGHWSPYGNTKQWCGLPLKHQVTTEICVRESLCITIPSPSAIPHSREGRQEWALYECWFSTNGGRFIYKINRPSCSARLHKPMVWRKEKKKPTLTLTGSHWNNLIPASIYPHDMTWPLTVCTGLLSGPEQSVHHFKC